MPDFDVIPILGARWLFKLKQQGGAGAPAGRGGRVPAGLPPPPGRPKGRWFLGACAADIPRIPERRIRAGARGGFWGGAAAGLGHNPQEAGHGARYLVAAVSRGDSGIA